jgi:hypothetical protein
VPVRVEFRNPADEPVRGFAEMAVKSDSGNVKIRLSQNIPGRARVDLLGYAYFPSTGRKQEVQGAPQLTVVEWRQQDGSHVARGALFGRPLIGSGVDAENVAGAGTLLLLWSERAEVAREDDRAHNSAAFAEMLTGMRAITQSLKAATVERRFLPQKLVGYASARYVVIDGAEVEALDQAQRRALLAHIRSGGVLVISAPSADGAADPSSSWLGPFLPVQFVGDRELSEIRPASRYVAGGGKPLLLRRP